MLTSLIVVAIFTASCTREIIIPFSTNNTSINNSTTVTGDFILTKFTNNNSNQDSSTEFNGYVFSFSSDGKITVIKNNQIALATYTETYFYNGNPQTLGFYFTNRPLSDLNKFWHVNLISDDAIHLTDASGEVLEFTVQ